MACRSQFSRRAVTGVAPSPFLQPVRSLHVFRSASLGRVDKAQEQLAWGSANVYSETPPQGPRAFQ